MKTHFLMATRVAVAVGALASSASSAEAQSLTGTWLVESQTRRGTQTITLDLVQDGSELGGAVTITMGGGRGGGGGGAPTFDIDEGTVDGSSFSFSYTLTFNGTPRTFSASGTFEGDEMEGSFDGGGRGGGRPFTGVRGG